MQHERLRQHIGEENAVQFDVNSMPSNGQRAVPLKVKGQKRQVVVVHWIAQMVKGHHVDLKHVLHCFVTNHPRSGQLHPPGHPPGQVHRNEFQHLPCTEKRVGGWNLKKTRPRDQTHE